MTTQEELITWHKYPDEKPQQSDWYLVDEGEDGIDRMYWSPGDWHYKHWKKIIAWANLPKGWQE